MEMRRMWLNAQKPIQIDWGEKKQLQFLSSLGYVDFLFQEIIFILN